MFVTPEMAAEIQELLDALREDTIVDSQCQRLTELLHNPEIRQMYIHYMNMVSVLCSDSHRMPSTCFTELTDTIHIDIHSEPKVPPTKAPFLPNVFQDGFFASGWAVSYTISAVIVGVALFIASLIYLPEATKQFSQSGDNDNAKIAAATKGQSDQKRPASADQAMRFVGRITGMVDCEFSDEKTVAVAGASVPLGRKYALARGLMEITYNSGAKVILQGPCQYEVNDPAGGYLSLGKLTARIDKKNSKNSSRNSKILSVDKKTDSTAIVDQQKPLAGNEKSFANEKTSPAGNKNSPAGTEKLASDTGLFTITTPTARITDLGTEFGVAVEKDGSVTSYVFAGIVKVQLVGMTASKENTVILRANESIRTERTNANLLAFSYTNTTGSDFVRRLSRAPKVLDLMDIVAGGDGTGARRECGIDAATGMQDTSFIPQDRGGSPLLYLPVSWNKFVDGVFVVTGRAGAVQLDSAGHRFNGFPVTRGTAFGSIWARATKVAIKANMMTQSFNNTTDYWVYNIDDDAKYMPTGRGLLALHPNAGITFDLRAIKRAYPDVCPACFRAMLGVPNKNGLVDVWIFVDGQLKLGRGKLRKTDGIELVHIELDRNAEFLTLVTTDGGNDYHNDGVVFGDAILEMVPRQ